MVQRTCSLFPPISGYPYVAEHIRESYHLNHLVETNAPLTKIYETSLKLVKAANDVHQICRLGRVIPKKWMPNKKRKPASAAAGTPSVPQKKPRAGDPVDGDPITTVPDAPAYGGSERRSSRIAAAKAKVPIPTIQEG